MFTKLFHNLFNQSGGAKCDNKKRNLCKSKGKTCNTKTGRCNKIYEEVPKKKRGRPKKVQKVEPKKVEPKKVEPKKVEPKKVKMDGKCSEQKKRECIQKGKVCNIKTGRCNKIYEEVPKKKRGRPKKIKKVEIKKAEPKKVQKVELKKAEPKKVRMDGKCSEQKKRECIQKGKVCNIKTGRCNKIYKEKPKELNKKDKPKKVKVKMLKQSSYYIDKLPNTFTQKQYREQMPLLNKLFDLTKFFKMYSKPLYLLVEKIIRLIIEFPTIKKELKKMPLGKVNSRSFLKKGTQLYYLNKTIHKLTGLILHTENAKDLGPVKDYPYIIMNLTESTIHLVFDSIFTKNGNQKTKPNERSKIFQNYKKDMLGVLSGGCLENILNSWTITVTTTGVIEFKVDKTLSVLTNIGELLTNLVKVICKESMILRKNYFLNEFMDKKEQKKARIKYALLELTLPSDIIKFLKNKQVINKPASDGKITEKSITDYLKWIDWDEEEVSQRCAKIWA